MRRKTTPFTIDKCNNKKFDEKSANGSTESISTANSMINNMNRARVILSLILALFGVYSVSSPSLAYPLTKSYSSSDDNSTATPKPTRASRETPAPTSNSPSAPMSPGSHNLSLGLGQVFLLGDLGNQSENSLGFDAHYNYGVSDLFAFDSDFGYSSHSNKDLSRWNIAAGLRTNLVYFDQLVPFFNIDLGFYHLSETFLNSTNASGLLFGLQLGGGLDLFLTNRVFFGTRLTFHDMFSSTKTASNGSQVSVGGSFMTFMIHAGVAF